jgi:hypothetical protein
MKIGRVGVWTGYGLIGTENAGETVALAEALGFGTFWPQSKSASGADHVCLQPVGAKGVPRYEWSALAEAML